jgi:predicted nucleotide-binding protein (sugar kinase/HSP70/actin superfamily)
MNRIKASHPHVNIAAIDYDPSTSPVNQHNRIKLMLSGNEEPRSEVPTENQKQTDTEAVPV